MKTLMPQKDVILAPLTTLHVGGAAEHFAKVTTIDELRDALSWARENEQQVIILGGGSNVLVSDDGVKGLVIKMNIGGLGKTMYIKALNIFCQIIILILKEGSVFVSGQEKKLKRCLLMNVLLDQVFY